MLTVESFEALFVSPPNRRRFVSDGANQALSGFTLCGLCPVKVSSKWPRVSTVAGEGIITTNPREAAESVRCLVRSSSSGYFSVIWSDVMYVLSCFGVRLRESHL